MKIDIILPPPKTEWEEYQRYLNWRAVEFRSFSWIKKKRIEVKDGSTK